MPVLRTIVVASLAAVGLAQAAVAQGIEQLYEAAKKEGALVLYGGGPITLYEPWAHEFEQRFPGIKVTAKAGSSNHSAQYPFDRSSLRNSSPNSSALWSKRLAHSGNSGDSALRANPASSTCGSTGPL